MREAPLLMSKQNRATKTEVSSRKPVPHENCYHTELSMVLRKWLPSAFLIYDEVTPDGDNSCDIQITDPRKQKYLLELVAHVEDGNEQKPAVIFLT